MEQARSLVRMTCPYESVATLEKLGANQEYWAGVSAPIWAKRFWQAALQRAVAADLKYPVGLHAGLVVEFAVNHVAERERAGSILVIRGAKPLAIWKLQQNLQVMRQTFSVVQDGGMTENPRSTKPEAGLERHLPSEDISYQGLPTEIECCLHDLIVTSNEVVSSLSHDAHPVTTKTLELFMKATKTHLDDPGLSGWVACRCAITILRSCAFLDANSLNQELVDGIKESLLEFYRIGNVSLTHNTYLLQRFPFSMPLAVRLVHGAKPLPVDRIVADLVRGGLDYAKKNNCFWIADIPVHRAGVRSLVESCRSDLSQLLRFVGETNDDRFSSHPRVEGPRYTSNS